MSVSITYNDVINLTSNGVSFKKEDKYEDNSYSYYIICYVNSIVKFKLKYTVEATRNTEFNNLIDDMYNGIVNIDSNYTGEVIE